MKFPRWKDLLNESLSISMKDNKDSISYCLSTITKITGKADEEVIIPESRFLVHRGFVNERRGTNDKSSNPIGIGSGISLLACTDIRSKKIDQIVYDNSKKVNDHQLGQISSICWWLEPRGEQYRIQARTYVVPPPSIESNYPKILISKLKELSPPRSKESSISKLSLNEKEEEEEDEGGRIQKSSESFDWEEERRRIFYKLSPELKASFLRKPITGSRLEDQSKDWLRSLEEGDENYDRLCSEGLENFALLIFDPFSVDLTRLKVEPNERLRWTRKRDSKIINRSSSSSSSDSIEDSWDEVELVP